MHVKIGSRKMKLPRTRLGRLVLGITLVLGGIFSFLPILGIWMLPLGLVILSVDSSPVRRFRRRNEVRLLRWWRARAVA